MDKRELGLTNADVADIIYSLNDRDFYEVMTELNKKNSTEKSIGEWIDMCMDEIGNLGIVN